MQPGAKSFPLTIRTVSRPLTVSVACSDLVGTVKDKIATKFGVSPNKQHLCLLCKPNEPLSDERPLSDYNIKEGTAIGLALRLLAAGGGPFATVAGEPGPSTSTTYASASGEGESNGESDDDEFAELLGKEMSGMTAAELNDALHDMTLEEEEGGEDMNLDSIAASLREKVQEKKVVAKINFLRVMSIGAPRTGRAAATLFSSTCGTGGKSSEKIRSCCSV